MAITPIPFEDPEPEETRRKSAAITIKRGWAMKLQPLWAARPDLTLAPMVRQSEALGLGAQGNGLVSQS